MRSTAGHVEKNNVLVRPPKQVILSFYYFKIFHFIICSVGKLTWHDECIPQEEVWVKIGGDHGGGSFKLSFQLANMEHVNSIRNTHPISCFEAADSITNLHVGLKIFQSQIIEMKRSSSRS